MRLRPSGASGLLVAPVSAFAEYQHQEAWTWEHQALVRARMIYGDELLADAFMQTRHQILSRVRDASVLKQEVIEMREKMRQHLAEKKPGRFMLKQDRGGITDIEFLAQYLVLCYSSQYPDLTRWSDNVRIFESLLSVGMMSQEQVQDLIEAYTAMRDQIHHRNLLNLDADVSQDKFLAEREVVIQAWQQWLG